MYDTSPLPPFKGETKPFLHVGLDSKTLESYFDLHPSLENSFDLTDFVDHAVGVGGAGSGNVAVAAATASPPTGVPDGAVVTSPVASSATDLVTLSSAATSQHLAEIERQSLSASIITSTSASLHHHHHQQHHHHHHHHHHSNNNGGGYVSQQTSPGPVPSTSSPASHPHHHHPHPHPQHHQPQQQPLPGYQQQQQQQPQPVLSPSLTVDDVSQAFSDDSCVFMPEYEQLTPAAGASTSGPPGSWGSPGSFYNMVKSEDLDLGSLTACSLETNLPGFTSSTTTSSSSAAATPSTSCKMEFTAGGAAVAGGGAGAGGAGAFMGMGVTSPTPSMRTLSESSTATTSSTLPPDSPTCGRRRGSGSGGKGGSKRRQVPKGSEEYKEKRARNNVAVRKSRAKAKEKQRLTESRVKELTELNETLQKKVDTLTKELTVLRGLFLNVGGAGASLPDDLSKLLGDQS